MAAAAVPGFRENWMSFKMIMTDAPYKIGMSSLALDLYLWNQLVTEGKAFDAFWSIMDQAPPGSPAKKLRDTDLAMDHIKELVIGPGFKMSKSHLDKRIVATGKYLKTLKPEEFSQCLIQEEFLQGPILNENFGMIPDQNMFHEDLASSKVIRSLPKARKFVRKLINVQVEKLEAWLMK